MTIPLRNGSLPGTHKPLPNSNGRNVQPRPVAPNPNPAAAQQASRTGGSFPERMQARQQAQAKPLVQQEWNSLQANLKRPSGDNPPTDRPKNSVPYNKPTAAESQKAHRISEDMAAKREKKSDMMMLMHREFPGLKAGEKPQTPGDTAMFTDFEKRQKNYRDPDSGQGFGELKNKGEFTASYRINKNPVTGEVKASTDDFKFVRGHGFNLDTPTPGGVNPQKRVHTHNDNHLPIFSPADHQTGSKFFANHGEENFLINSEGNRHKMGMGPDGAQFEHVRPWKPGDPRPPVPTIPLSMVHDFQPTALSHPPTAKVPPGPAPRRDPDIISPTPLR